ncbi:arginine deiminase-related protein [Vibrio chagasii]|nr:arginine deiminase-related protein [Vibrio chagasii]
MSFLNRVNLTEAEVKLETMAEFKAMVASLRKEGVQVVEFDYPELGVETPDAVSPNNWFSTCSDGSLFTFPMVFVKPSE